MEGVSNEAASLAGHLKLTNLCWIYDNNHITIEGETELAYSDDVPLRFKGLGWNVIKCDDANDTEALTKAYKKFLRTKDKPTLIIVRSHIGYGAPHKQDTSKAHGEPLGADEIRAAKESYGWPADEQFLVPDEARQHFQEGVGGPRPQAAQGMAIEVPQVRQGISRSGAPVEADGSPRTARRLGCRTSPRSPPTPKAWPARVSGGKVLNAVAEQVPWLIGGSADLAPSTMTLQTFEGSTSFFARRSAGRNFHFGIREHGMAAALNGMAPSKVRPYGATFFVFFDYLQAVVPPERHQPPAGDLHFHARFDRPGRRWPDASADRTPGRHPRRAAGDHHSPGRRQRSRPKPGER